MLRIKLFTAGGHQSLASAWSSRGEPWPSTRLMAETTALTFRGANHGQSSNAAGRNVVSTRATALSRSIISDSPSLTR
jgi:hypothetical protein